MHTENPPLNEQVPPVQPRGRWMLLWLFIFFAAPLIMVTLMYQLDWHPAGSSRGEMLSPPRLLAMPAAMLESGAQPVAADFWKERWSMVYIADQCDERCSKRLYDMRQIHASLAKNVNRVQRVLITQQTDVASIRQRYPDLVILQPSTAALPELTQQFDLADAPAGNAARVYVVDPLAYLMMSYPASIPASDIRKDLGRLLAYAWAG